MIVQLLSLVGGHVAPIGELELEVLPCRGDTLVWSRAELGPVFKGIQIEWDPGEVCRGIVAGIEHELVTRPKPKLRALVEPGATTTETFETVQYVKILLTVIVRQGTPEPTTEKKT